MNKGNIFVNSWIIQLEHVNVTVTLEHTKNWKKHELYHNATHAQYGGFVNQSKQCSNQHKLS